MIRFKQLLCLLGILVAAIVQAQNARIDGSALSWAGKEVRLLVYENYLTKPEVILDQTTIDAEGNFSLEATFKETTEAWISVNRFTAPIFIGPGSNYQIKLRENRENVLVDTWQRGFFEYDFLELDSTDVNAQVAAFDQAYYSFYVDNQVFLGSQKMKARVDTFAAKYSQAEGDSFYKEYEKYAIAEMRLGAGFKMTGLYNDYIADQVNVKNPNSFRFFQQYFKNYFRKFDNNHGGATIYNRLNAGLSPAGLDSLLQKDKFLAHAETRYWVMLNSIWEVSVNRNYNKAPLQAVLAYLGEMAQSSELKKVSEELLTQLKDPAAQSFFELVQNWEPTIESFDNEKYTLVIIANSSSMAYQKEALVVETLLDKYEEIFQAIELDVNEMNSPSPKMWKRYHSKSAFKTLEDLQIYGLPHFMWLNKAGEIVESNLEKPSQGLEKRLYKIQTELKESQKIKVGSK